LTLCRSAASISDAFHIALGYLPAARHQLANFRFHRVPTLLAAVQLAECGERDGACAFRPYRPRLVLMLQIATSKLQLLDPSAER